jgi:uncharacterized protein YndB with AHSA1/START domain
MMNTLQYQIEINAPAEKVWNTMLNADTYQEWTAVSWPNSLYEGKWEQGTTIKFIGPDGSGTLALLKTVEYADYLAAEHIAVLLPGGKEETGAPAKDWIGTEENYTFEAHGDATLLKIDMLTHPSWEKMFNDGWPPALAKLKEICERG